MIAAPIDSSLPVLRVGVTGHRFDKLPASAVRRLEPDVAAILDVIVQVLREARAGAGDGSAPPVLRVVSPLAEGADRLVAKAGLARGAELIAPLPFPRALYLRDFETAASRDEFAALLALAAEVIELDGNRDSEADRNAAYEKVGDRVVDESDVLLALWDGAAAAGRGGTAEVVARARRNGCPVVWLPADGAPMRLLVGDLTVETDVPDALRRIVRRTLAAPRPR